MSIKYTSAIWEHSQHSGSKLLVLLAIADHANDQGVCWPSIPTLAKKARVSERQAQRIVQELCDSGEIEIIKRGDGRGNSTLYRVKGDIAMSPFTETEIHVKGDIQRVKGDIQRVKGDIAMSPEPSIESPIEPKEEKIVSPPATLQASSSTGDPYMDAATAKFNRKGRVNSWQAEMNLRLAADKRLPLVNSVGKVCGLTALMDTKESVLVDAHTAACWFYEHGYTGADKIEALYRQYLSDEWRRKNHPKPSIDSFMTFASKQLEANSLPNMNGSGKHGTTAGVIIGSAEKLR